MKTKFLLLPLIVLAMASCEEDDNMPDPTNEEELITTVKMVFTPSGEMEESVFIFTDPDGSGGEEPEMTGDTLHTNTTYDVSVYFLNESVTPTDSLNTEIWVEGDEHQVFLLFDPPLGISYSYTDADVMQNPVGLGLQVVTDTAAGTTQMQVVLRHEPDKDAAGVDQGDISNAGGETDVEVTFEVPILE